MGDVVNLAARLMCQIKDPDGGVLIDEPTKLACVGFDYEELPPLTLKGMKKPVKAFKPTQSQESLQKTAAQRKIQFEDKDHLSGREDERDVLRNTVQSLHAQKVCRPVAAVRTLTRCNAGWSHSAHGWPRQRQDAARRCAGRHRRVAGHAHPASCDGREAGRQLDEEGQGRQGQEKEEGRILRYACV